MSRLTIKRINNRLQKDNLKAISYNGLYRLVLCDDPNGSYFGNSSRPFRSLSEIWDWYDDYTITFSINESPIVQALNNNREEYKNVHKR